MEQELRELDTKNFEQSKINDRYKTEISSSVNYYEFKISNLEKENETLDKRAFEYKSEKHLELQKSSMDTQNFRQDLEYFKRDYSYKLNLLTEENLHYKDELNKLIKSHNSQLHEASQLQETTHSAHHQTQQTLTKKISSLTDQKRLLETQNVDLKSKSHLSTTQNSKYFSLKKEKYELEHKVIELKR